MTDQPPEIPDAVWNALQGSGFPFQTAIRHRINPSIGWQVVASEYPWQAANGNHHFLDIVAGKHSFIVCIECKKTSKETWTFLRPIGLKTTGEVEEFRCLRAKRSSGSGLAEVFCETWALRPSSTESEFCIVSTSDSGKDQRMLERDAHLLVQATEACARHLDDHLASSASEGSLFLPLIVTNAKIYTVRYQPTEVSLETGQFVKPPRDLGAARWVRFRKAFTSDSSTDLGDRSIFVVQAEALVDFLQTLSPSPTQPLERVEVRIR